MAVLIYLSTRDSLFYLIQLSNYLFHLSDDPHLFYLIGYDYRNSIRFVNEINKENDSL